MTSKMASSGLREYVILTKIILTIDGTIGCAKGFTDGAKWFGTKFWCRTICLPVLYGVDTSSASPTPYPTGGGVGYMWCATRWGGWLFKVEGRIIM